MNTLPASRRTSSRRIQPTGQPYTGGSAARARLLGLPVDPMRMEEALARLAGWIDTACATRSAYQPLQKEEAPSGARQIITLNPEIAMAARHDDALHAAIASADLVLPDGTGIVWALRLRGRAVPERVTGVDLLDAFAGLAAERGYRLYLLGAAPGVAETAASRLAARHPGLMLAGTHAGSPDETEAPGLIARINASGADALFVAFGAPAQERWIAAHRQQLGAAVAMGVGGAFDFLAGRVPRAPGWMRRAGLEWLYRLARQPWRWRRMLALPRFAIAALGEAARARPRSRGNHEERGVYW